MPRPALTSDEIADFRARLTEVATHLFAKHGFEGVTLRAVAAELGVSPMTPYRYVSGKEELETLVRIDAFRRLSEAQERAAKSRGDALARLRALGRSYVEFAIQNPDAYRIMFELRQPDDAPDELVKQSARSFTPLRVTCGEAVEEGVLEGDADIHAHLLWATTHGLVTLHLAGKLKVGRSLAELTRHVLDTVTPKKPKGTKR